MMRQRPRVAAAERCAEKRRGGARQNGEDVGGYIPKKIVAGVTLEIPVSLTAYAAPAWALSLILRGPAAIDLSSTDNGSAHTIKATAAETAAWASGSYWFSLRATDGVDVIEVEDGTIEILPDLAAQGADYDGRGHVEKVLAAIEAVIEGRASKDQERYRINNRELQRTPISDLIALRDKYRAEARKQSATSARGNSLLGRRVLTRF